MFEKDGGISSNPSWIQSRAIFKNLPANQHQCKNLRQTVDKSGNNVPIASCKMFAIRCRIGTFALGVLMAATVLGCKTTPRPTPLPEGVDPQAVRDAAAPPVQLPQWRFRDYLDEKRRDNLRERNGQAKREGLPTDEKVTHYDALVLSGGSADGAYQAGMLVGWSCRGDRPKFDVICGVSAGALVGALTFPGQDYDGQLQHFFTTVRNEDIMKAGKMFDDVSPIRKLPGIFTTVIPNVRRYGTIADNAPLADKMRTMITPEYLAVVAAEHAKGRRFYVGTTNLDTKRFIVWDMGAIASRGPDAADLYIKVLLASSGINAVMPPTLIPVEIDGHCYQEMHTDGGAIRRLFFQPPIDKKTGLVVSTKYGLSQTDLYVIVAGQIHGEATGVPQKLFPMVIRSLSTQLEANARAQLFNVYAHAVVAKMNPHFAAVPDNFSEASGLATFDPVEMTKLFTAGYDRIRNPDQKLQWDKEPPEQMPYDEFVIRGGTQLTSAPRVTLPPTDPSNVLPPPPVSTGRPIGPRIGKAPAYTK